MRAKAFVKQMRISDGSTVDLPECGVVLVVGPNNAGKSQALRDIRTTIGNGDTQGVVVVGVEVGYTGASSDLIETMRADRSIVERPGLQDLVDLGSSGQQSTASAAEWWTGARSKRLVAPYFVLSADTESRLAASRPTEALDLYRRQPEHPLHYLYERRDIEGRLDGISREAFGQGIVLDTWAGGSSWSLRMGDIDAPSGPRPSQDFLDELRSLVLLSDQGDGVRSMIGLLLNLLTGHQTISLIDEPEAFLHPPQARYLARILSDDASASDSVTFMSTHSADIVHGTLEGLADTTVVRLVRDGETNHASVLDNSAVRHLWRDPLLRYSNLLEGLFSDAVVVCESDADCKFFASVMDTLGSGQGQERRPDLLFTHCGGKNRMHIAVDALRAASVPVVVVGDFDVLNDWEVLGRLIDSFGGNRMEFESDWKILNSALTSQSRTPSIAGMREAVLTAFDNIQVLTSRSLAPVREAMKLESGWDKVKNTGLSGVPKGNPFSSCERLVGRLAALGIHLVPVGEMEDFVPGVAGHGPGWLSEVLQTGVHETDAADEARSFVARILASLT